MPFRCLHQFGAFSSKVQFQVENCRKQNSNNRTDLPDNPFEKQNETLGKSYLINKPPQNENKLKTNALHNETLFASKQN